MRAIIYARYSSDRQNDRSIEDQIAACRTFCDREGLTVVGTAEDRAMSGASIVDRIGLARVMADARAGRIDVVVAESLDRISRDQEDLAGLFKRLRFAGVQIRTIQDGVAGDIQIGVKGLMGSLFLRDLAMKTHRGMAGAIREGRSASGRSFGYRSIPGQPGALRIDPAEAETVRRIFAEYVDGRVPREIARRLNSAGVAGPRGGAWNMSTIIGSRIRLNGILNNALYTGQIIWNRQRFEKDPDTGRRISRPNPRAQWMTADAPDLRIVDQAVWEAAQRILAKRSRTSDSKQATRQGHLLSGLLRCGCCGGNYSIVGKDKRGRVVGCSRSREGRGCTNTRTLAVEAIERRILDGLVEHLGDADEVAAYVREYHRARAELVAAERAASAGDERRLAELKTKIGAIVTAVENGGSTRAMLDRLRELEGEREALEAKQAHAEPPPVIDLHPGAVDAYRRQIVNLRSALDEMDANDDGRRNVERQIRELVDQVVITPQGKYKPADLVIHGQLARLLEVSSEPSKSVKALVAGARFELTTFRL